MTWRIRLAHDGEEPGLAILGVLTAQLAWKRLSKPAQEAVLAAYPDGQVKAHPLTLTALRRHGFAECPLLADCRTGGACTVPCWPPVLTAAGREVARWNCEVKS